MELWSFNNLFRKSIQVGSTSSSPGGVFQFIPNNVTATNGSVITFKFAGMYVHHIFFSHVHDVQVARSQPRKPLGYTVNFL